MAFSFGGSTQNVFGTPGAISGGGAQGRTGADLEEITTEGLGFLALGGEAKVQLLPSPWPADNLPPPTASLMSIASMRGLLAAAGPDAVIVASTESVRKAFEEPRSGDSEVRPFRPQLTLPMPMRISQVSFTADENFLVLSAEAGGGLAVYEVQNLLNGSTQSAFEMPTNSLSLRALIPNPAPEKGELLAIVTTNGKLMMANLKERTFVSGANGQILKEGVSCVSWSTKGKQLVAGLGDGTSFQMTPEGEGKDEIPRAPNVDLNHHVSSITWLENNVFLSVSNPSNFDSSSSSVFNVITRQAPSEFVFQKIADPATPFGLPRYPPHHFLLRLREWGSLQDLLIVASSASTDIGLFSRSKTPLVADKPSDKIVGVFTMTELYDSRRAQLPMTDEAGDTSPIGVGLDLSSREKVVRPIPSDEMDESRTPVPALMVLNNQGVLASWWVIYSESIKQGSMYPGLVTASGVQQSMQPASQPSSAFGASAPTAILNQPSGSTAFSGFKPAVSTFGAPSGLGQQPSLWGRPAPSNAPTSGPTFGTPSFGSTTTPNAQGVAFGAPALPGARTSPWSTGTTKPPGATLGQPAALGSTSGSAFGSSPGGGVLGSSSGTNIPPSGGFALFAGKGGFAAAAAATAPGASGNIFGSKPAINGFPVASSSSNNESGTIFGNSSFTTAEKPSGLLGSSGFTLGSTFKPDGSAKDDETKPNNDGSPFFGSGFDAALTDAQKAPSPVMAEADMDADEPEPLQKPEVEPEPESKQPVTTSQGLLPSTTPTSTPAAPKFQFPTAVSPVKGGLFGTPASSEAPAANSEKKSTGLAVGALSSAPDKPQASTSAETSSIPAPTNPEGPKIKEEPQSEEELEKSIEKIPEAPLPPDPTSKASYFVGESSVSSTEPDAPLPPDFIPATTSKKLEELKLPLLEKKAGEHPSSDLIPPSYVPGGPEEREDSDFGTEDEDNQSEGGSDEGSGEDVAKDVSPTSELHQTPGFTPQSSFDVPTSRGTTEGFTSQNSFGSGSSATRGTTEGFFKIPPQPKDTNSRSLFGEINDRNTPVLYPTKLFPSPRSPSPIRNSIPGRLLRPDTSRSVSAPGVASQLLGPRRSSTDPPATTSSSAFTSTMEQRKAEERRKAEAKTRKEAEETQALIDKEDESIQSFLKREIVGTKILDDFIAHQDYVGNADKDSIPAQVEAVYRDINSMIDTLGINSCSLKSFIKGHEEQYKKSRRTRRDLEDDEDWCLVEIDSLSNIATKDLTTKLEQGRIKDVASKLEACADLEKDVAKLRAKHEDIKTLLTSYSDPDNVAIARSQPLTAEQAVQQHDLRRDLTKFQKLLNEAEEGLTMLRAKLASQGNTNGNATAGPTVEAVMRTIMKMTNMAEKRSGDIDVLENHMRKLRLGSTSNGSRESSPFATPANKASMRGAPGTSSTYSAFYTPSSVIDTSHGFHTSLTSSTHSFGRRTPPRRKMSGFSEEDRQRLKTNAARKKAVTDRLRKALEKSGVRVQPMDSD